jgi:hypothetical protein
MTEEWANKDKYHPSNGVLEPRMKMPRPKVIVRTVSAWGDRKVTSGAAGRAPQVRPVHYTGQTGAHLGKQRSGFRAREDARFVSGGCGFGGWHGEFVCGQFARRSHLVLNTRVGGVVALRWRGDGPRSSFRGFCPPPAREVWLHRSGYRDGVHGGSFDRRDDLVCANPTLE